MSGAPGDVAGWRLLRPLGQGALGSVYLAEGHGHAAPVALKLVPLDASGGLVAAQAAFLASAAVAERLRHPDIVAVHAAGTEGATGWLAMEAVPGSDLGRYTVRARLLPEPVVAGVVARVAQALAYAHRQGVVHRDIKPANVLVHWPTDTVKLADFGLARAGDAAQTGTGIVPGTPAYMAPEQLAGNVPTARSDLYALGVLLFQLRSGRLPHEAGTMGALLQQVATQPAPALSAVAGDVAPALERLVARLLAKRPAERPADAEEAATVLRALAVPGAP